ncbi:MAG: outer membrane lipoprotein-sorting protein [Bacteroidales bacterium]|nr:outer membrane lipoprotein-sorting protein [Bacteroidales bacterium]
MKRFETILLILACMFMLLSSAGYAQDMSAKDIVREAEDQWQGEKSSISTMTMKIIRPTWERTIEMKNWIKGRHFALTLITGPASEKGQTFLKRHNDMWHWMPSIGRLIKLPPSMMSQGWMGSDYTNDDILKESSIVTDYQHSLIGEEPVNGRVCYKIRMIPNEDAAVVWGKVIKWISKQHYNQLKSEYYDEDGERVRTELLSHLKSMDNRIVPTHIEVTPEDEKNKKTVLELNQIKFNRDIPDGFFSQQNMKRVRP